MAIQRMDNVLIVVNDLDAVITFFVELGMELEGTGPLDWRGAERVIDVDVRQRRVAGRQLRRVLRLALEEAHVLDHHDVRVGHVIQIG